MMNEKDALHSISSWVQRGASRFEAGQLEQALHAWTADESGLPSGIFQQALRAWEQMLANSPSCVPPTELANSPASVRRELAILRCKRSEHGPLRQQPGKG